jgi:hypothetical protein
VKRVIPALLIAAALASLVAIPEIAGVATWKWVLGLVGLVLFIAAGRRRS